MKVGNYSTVNGRLLMGVLAVVGSWCASGAFAADRASRTTDAQHHSLTQQQHTPAPQHRGRTNELVKIVRDATWRFRDVSQAVAEGYVLNFGCVTGSHEGAMGLHFVNGALVEDPTLDATRPELLVYEPLENGQMRLAAVDYLVFKEAWDAANTATPQLMGQLFHLFDSPNRYGLPAFYTLHVWAWKQNPNGTFANWNPRVSCDAFNDAHM